MTPISRLLGAGQVTALLVPTAPVPVCGALIDVPEAWVSPADVGVDGGDLGAAFARGGWGEGDRRPSEVAQSFKQSGARALPQG